MGKHTIWALALIIITLIICGTLIWINHNSWTVRFEMDDNTLQAVESVEWEEINEGEKCMNEINSCEFCWSKNKTKEILNG